MLPPARLCKREVDQQKPKNACPWRVEAFVLLAPHQISIPDLLFCMGLLTLYTFVLKKWGGGEINRYFFEFSGASDGDANDLVLAISLGSHLKYYVVRYSALPPNIRFMFQILAPKNISRDSML